MELRMVQHRYKFLPQTWPEGKWRLHCWLEVTAMETEILLCISLKTGQEHPMSSHLLLSCQVSSFLPLLLTFCLLHFHPNEWRINCPIREWTEQNLLQKFPKGIPWLYFLHSTAANPHCLRWCWGRTKNERSGFRRKKRYFLPTYISLVW